MAVTEFLWDPVTDCVAQERDGTGAITANYAYEPEPYGRLSSETRGEETRYYHADALGSTRLMTDETGQVTDTFEYSAWGEETSRTGTNPTPYRWVGKVGYQRTAAAGILSLRARSYSIATGRFLSSDPALETHAWDYAGNDPLMRIDPSGLEWIPHKRGDNPQSAVVWRATNSGDSLQDLARLVTGDALDWPCVWPIANTKAAEALWRDLYPLGACGLTADVSNLRANTGPSFRMSPSFSGPIANPSLYATGSPSDYYLRAMKKVANPARNWTSGVDAATIIQKESGQGKTPIQQLVVIGHGFRNNDIGTHAIVDNLRKPFNSGHIFEVAEERINHFNTFQHAKERIGPPKCWFTRNAMIYGAACNTTDSWQGDWAGKIARPGSKVLASADLLYGELLNSGLAYVAFYKDRATVQYYTFVDFLSSPKWTVMGGNAR